MAIESTSKNTTGRLTRIAMNLKIDRLRENRWLRLLDLALPITAALLFLTDQTVLFFHMIFVFLTLGAFWWKFRGFVLRAIFWVGLNTALVLRAVVTGQTQAEELIEIPLLTLILLMVYAIARQRTKAEQALQRANENLEMSVEERTIALQKSNDELNEFVSVAAHNLQEPLRKIQVFDSRLESSYGDSLANDELNSTLRMRESAGQMHESAKRMSALVEDLRVFSQVSTSAQPLIPVDLGVSVRQALSDLEVSIEQVEGRVELADLPTIIADPTQMQILFHNLIANAMKFCRPEESPVVKISTQEIDDQNGRMHEHPQTDEFCQLIVEDNGLGFDQKHLDRIFTIFQKLHNPSEYGGNGVGLTICRKIVERCGGAITAESTLGKGTKFIITLPVASVRAAVGYNYE